MSFRLVRVSDRAYTGCPNLAALPNESIIPFLSGDDPFVPAQPRGQPAVGPRIFECFALRLRQPQLAVCAGGDLGHFVDTAP